MSRRIIVRILVLVATIALSANVVVALDNQTVASWSTNFTNLFSYEMSIKMRMKEIQQVYDTTPRSTIKVNGAVELAAATAKVDSLLSLVVADLDAFVVDIFSNNVPTFSSTLKSPSSLYRYFAHAKNGSIVMEKNADTVPLHRTDARLTPWYSNAVAGPKHVFVVVDLRISNVDTIDRIFFLERMKRAGKKF
jgi:hypothetical protein